MKWEDQCAGIGQLSSAWLSADWHWEQAEVWSPGARQMSFEPSHTQLAIGAHRDRTHTRDALRAQLYLKDIDDERRIFFKIPSIFR